MKAWLIVSIICKIIDVTSTFIVVTNQGLHEENNILLRNMLHHYGPGIGLVINALMFLIFVSVLYRFNRKGLLVLVTFSQIILAALATASIFIH